MKPIAFIHIGKTGGSAIKAMLRGDNRFVLYRHDMTLPNLWRETPDMPVFFVVRDPIERFVSGFYSRLRKGAANNIEWQPEEEVAFGAFQTPNDLAEGLSAPDRWERTAAHLAMHAISHVRHPLHLWLRSARFLERHRCKILFVGWTDTLTQELPMMRSWLGLGSEYVLPSDPTIAHRSPESTDRYLSDTARRNLADWYAGDREVLEWCLAWRADKGLV